jgi:hypothetical protein
VWRERVNQPEPTRRGGPRAPTRGRSSFANRPPKRVHSCRKTISLAPRLFTRGGYDWTRRYPWIIEAALKNRHKRFVLDGEAVILGVDGVSDFNALHFGKHNEEVQLCAFDLANAKLTSPKIAQKILRLVLNQSIKKAT